MGFEADIVVAGPGGRVHLVAETKLSLDSAASKAGKAALKEYMVGMRCPVGLLVTQKTVALFRDRYTDYTADSIEEVGEFPITASFLHEAKDPLDFERAVQTWLEGLLSPSARSQLSADLREAVEEYVLPALEEGELRASGPRQQQRATT